MKATEKGAAIFSILMGLMMVGARKFLFLLNRFPQGVGSKEEQEGRQAGHEGDDDHECLE